MLKQKLHLNIPIFRQQFDQYFSDELHVLFLSAEHEPISDSHSTSTSIDTDYQEEHETNKAIPYNPEALSDLIRDLDLSKKRSWDQD